MYIYFPDSAHEFLPLNFQMEEKAWKKTCLILILLSENKIAQEQWILRSENNIAQEQWNSKT